MTVHKRIRRFNTRDTYPDQKLDNDLCQAVVAEGTMVFVRGQVGQELDSSESVAIGDAVGQAEKAMANIEVLLKEAGSQLEHVCKITIYIVDPRYREGVYRVVGKWLKGVFPVSTGIVVSALARPEWLVEGDATAVIPDQRGGRHDFLPERPVRGDRDVWHGDLVLLAGGRGALRSSACQGRRDREPEHHRSGAGPDRPRFARAGPWRARSVRCTRRIDPLHRVPS